MNAMILIMLQNDFDALLQYAFVAWFVFARSEAFLMLTLKKVSDLLSAALFFTLANRPLITLDQDIGREGRGTLQAL